MEAQSPLAYYRLGDSSGQTAADSSGNGLAGTYSASGVTLGQAGVLEPGDPTTSAGFNGTTGDVALPGGFANFTGGFTFEAWVYPTSTASQQIFDLGNGASSDNIRLVYASSSLYFYVYQGSNGKEISGSSTLVQNTWQQISVTLDGSGNAVMYWDGLPTASGAVGVQQHHPDQELSGRGRCQRVRHFQRPDAGSGVLQPGGVRRSFAEQYDIATARGTLLDRDNTAAGSYGIELQTANNVTLAELNITGAYDGIHTTSGSSANASAGLTVSNSVLFDNYDAGVNVDPYSSNASLGSDTAYGLRGVPTSTSTRTTVFTCRAPVPR